MQARETTFLDCLDEFIKKAPPEEQTGLKEVIGSVVIQSVFSQEDFMPTLQKMQGKIPRSTFVKVLIAYRIAKLKAVTV